MSNRALVIASRAAHVFGLPLVASKGSIYPDDARLRCQGILVGDTYHWVRESDGRSVACLSLYGDICGWRIDYHRRNESGVSDHPLGSHMMKTAQLEEALYNAEQAIRFLGKKYRP